MKTVLVRYKVKADRKAANIAYIKKVFEQLQQAQPDGLQYASFTQPDGVSFIHLAVVTAENGNPLGALSAFKAFTANIADRCEEPPVPMELSPVGSYRLLDDDTAD
jgi:hypothetical protein